MAYQDLEARRARDLERYHRRTAERLAQGLCPKCGKVPPAPERSVCGPCAGKKRPADRERYHRRTAERISQGLCPKCGKTPPAPGRTLCEPCGEKRNTTSRARDARLRVAGKPRRDLEKARAYGRELSRRRIAEHLAAGLCPKCGKDTPAPGRTLCEPCGEKRRVAERACYTEAKAAGKLYGGRDPEQRQRLARDKSRRRLRERLDAGLCTRCGQRPSVGGGTTCGPCREARQAAERALYAARRAAGLCVGCGENAFGGAARCAPCAVLDESRRSPERKNAAARRRYAERRARGQCTDCGRPSQGAARCAPCAERSYERSEHFRGIPIWDPQFTVIELATGDDHGTYDSEAEVAACLAFAKLSWEQVEVLRDVSPMATYTARG